MNRIIVTGGAGFVGSHLCNRLINQGNNVICVDNLTSGNINNIKNLKGNTNFTFITHDIEIPLEVGAKIDQIYNLASPASPPFYQIDPIKTFKTSIIGSINMLELAKTHNATILQASTSEVYGDPLIHPQVETYNGNVNPIGIRSCYDEGKRGAETLFMDYHRQYGINTRLIRIFNTYGTNMQPDDGRVVTNFIKQALTNTDITIYGDGNQTRSFQYVDDLIDGMIEMMNNSNGFIGPVNLGNPNEFTVSELAEKVIELTNSNSKIIYLPLPSDDPTKRKPNIELAKQELKGWIPKIQLEEGLKKTIEYFKTDLKY